MNVEVQIKSGVGKAGLYPTFVYLALLIYDMWMFIKQDNLENAMLMVFITGVSVIPWVYTLYKLGTTGSIGRAWLLLIPKLFASILGAYLMLKGAKITNEITQDEVSKVDAKKAQDRRIDEIMMKMLRKNRKAAKAQKTRKTKEDSIEKDDKSTGATGGTGPTGAPEPARDE